MDLMAIWRAVQGFIVGFIVRWLLVIGGTIFADAGVTEEDIYKIVGGVLAVVVSLVISLLQHKKAVEQQPTLEQEVDRDSK